MKYPGQYSALRVFLFACYTGLRISDIKALKWTNVDGNFIGFTPIKTVGFVSHLRIPFSPKAQALIFTKKGVLINCSADSNINVNLKEVALRCSIKKVVSMHVGRHTFATRLLSKGGKLERLQQLLGHIDIRSTMVYVHVSEDDLWTDANLL